MRKEELTFENYHSEKYFVISPFSSTMRKCSLSYEIKLSLPYKPRAIQAFRENWNHVDVHKLRSRSISRNQNIKS